MHQCTNGCFTDYHWQRVKAQRKHTHAVAAFNHNHNTAHYDHFNYPHYNIVAPGSICADHGCRAVHPAIDHAAYVRAYTVQ
jgi:hypothetical protein